MIPADDPVSEGFAPLPYLALLGVGAICGVISGAVSGTASPESAIGGGAIAMQPTRANREAGISPVFFPSFNSLLAATKPGVKSRWLIACLTC